MSLLPDTEPVDPFYRVVATDLMGAHGDVIRVRTMSGPAALESAAACELVIYQSMRVSDGAPIAVSGIVAIPQGNPPTGGWPVVSWSHGTVGVADRGAPSLDSEELADIGDPTDPPMTVHRKINAAPHGLLNEFLNRGWAVVMTDYEGLGTRGQHPYLFGTSEARGVLDIVRAARALHNRDTATGQETISRRFVIVGHSQGGQAALFAAHLAPTWTAELTLLAVAAIAPASAQERLLMLSLLPAAPDLAFLPLAIAGALASDPGLAPELEQKVFTPLGLQLFRDTIDVQTRVELSGPDSWGALPGRKYFRVLSRKPRLRAALTRMHPDLDIQVPIRISQALNDRRVSAAATRRLWKQLKRRNPAVTVEWIEYRKVAPAASASLGDHFGILISDVVPLANWLERKFSPAN
ncbi:Secretory lipase [Salinibacterium xinjiangense]|uniref:Secretory lipase n=1 Tax=Salinibacterium xinjiangense TaxID=386302 RepID=A0A2C9A1F6_9MICO|nr:alpha/beta hydrolase [Salinibacterium xinjiangense]SOE72691.1 Secretory lipase [Salinibacterium xinjiangense]